MSGLDFELFSTMARHLLAAELRQRVVLLAIYLICLFASFYAACRMLYLIGRNPSKAWVLAIAHDQLGNAALNGDPDETVSSRANRARSEGRRWGCVLCRILDWLQPDHCRDSAGV